MIEKKINIQLKKVFMSKNKKPKWDGKSRVSNDLYRKRYDEIFKKVTDDNAEKFVHNQDRENEEYLKELKEKL